MHKMSPIHEIPLEKLKLRNIWTVQSQPVVLNNVPKAINGEERMTLGMASPGYCKLACPVMSHSSPLPFRISVPGYDSIDSQGVVSISIKLEGLLHVLDDVVSLEWSATRKVESVSLRGIRDEVDQSPVGACDIPVDLILEARLRGGWWAPRLELRATRLDAFEEIPSAQNGTAKLRIQRRDREKARAVCAEINNASRLHDGENNELPRLQ
jgi:hypothetical protein